MDTSQTSLTPRSRVAYGRDMRRLFNFASGYTPLNHGSFGTIPRIVLEYRAKLIREWEERECISLVFEYPRLLKESRALVAPLLGAETDEVVFIPNATTGINTVLRNFVYEEGDLIIFPETIYSACRKTVQSLEETTPVRGYEIDVIYPIEDDDLVELFRATARKLADKGHRIRIAIFDTIASRPGVRVPWEKIVVACRELGILSVIDGAHAIGHIDMTHTGQVKPDFLVSNCHKWLFAPRPCAVFYVPFANQHLIGTATPTSHGYLEPSIRNSTGESQYFTELFSNGSTLDVTPYVTVPAALRFRDEICGGEAQIWSHCVRLAREGGDMVAAILSTEVLDNKSGSLRSGCAFANVRLPVSVTSEVGGDGEGLPREDVDKAIKWFYATTANEFDTYLQTFFYKGALWTRLSAQVYLEMPDFVWAAATLKDLCERLREGEWRSFEQRW
ncbi:aminotransferase family protein-like protein [Lasiosphaeria hispida]|uniref:Aminotransferase family protein-like protein n=1 Tax=Lasiosphaeria hispida TaxID=260671 RepID=A0AAJ0MCN6_9PEZI|nr:aminotransferase family protein-like protein [Lasiosphaeria hispida]